MEEAVERRGVAGQRLRIGVDDLAAEEQAEHAAHALGGERHAGIGAAASRPSHSAFVFASRRWWKPGAWTRSSIARPAAIATGLPLSVPAW